VYHSEIGGTNFVENFHYTKLRKNAWVRQEYRTNYSFILYTLPYRAQKCMECKAINLGIVFVVISSEFKDGFVKNDNKRTKIS